MFFLLKSNDFREIKDDDDDLGKKNDECTSDEIMQLCFFSKEEMTKVSWNISKTR